MKQLSADCISRIREGDAAAFAELFYAYKDQLFSYACKMSRSTELAAEVVQEAFMKVWCGRQQLDPQLSIQAYLHTVTRHCLFNMFRKAARDEKLKQAVFYGQPAAVNATEEAVLTAEMRQIERDMLDLLPPQRRQIFYLSRIEGLSHEEIARQLGISRNTVKDQIVKASRFLKQELHTRHDIIIPLLVAGIGAMHGQ